MLPRQLKYDSKVNSCSSKSRRVNIMGQNGSNYAAGQVLILNIPCSGNSVLCTTESYLRFNMNVTNGSGGACSYRLDKAGGHGFIQRIRIYSGSNILQDIDNYGILAKMMFDLQTSAPYCAGKGSILSGQRSEMYVGINSTYANAATLEIIDVDGNGMKGTYINSGVGLQGTSTAVPGAAVANNGVTITMTFCLNLISLIGTLCNLNYLPLFCMSDTNLRVEITFVDALQKAVCCYPTSLLSTFAITQCEYVAEYIDLGNEAMDIIRSSLNGNPLQFVFPSYSNYQYTAPVLNNYQLNIAIAAKFSSLKSLITTSRDKYGAETFFPTSSVCGGLTSYYYRIGANVMPTKPAASVPEFFAELVKSVGALGDLAISPSLNIGSYGLPISITNTAAQLCGGSVHSGSFYVGIDLESYANASKQECFTGYNTNSDDIFLVLQYGAVPDAAGATANSGIPNMRFDTFAGYDALLVCENHTAFVRT